MALMKPYKSRSHLIVPDVQTKPGVSQEHLGHIGNYIVDKQPEVIVCIGDFADMPSLSSYDKGKKSFEGRRYSEDIAAAQKGMDLLLEPLRKLQEAQRRAKKPVYRPRMVLTLGNHEERILRAIESDPVLEGTIAIDDLGYEKAGWEVVPYLQPITIDGIAYCHYFCTGSMGKPFTSAKAMVKAKHMSAIMGHTQQTDVYMGDTRADGRTITGVFVGTCYTHDEPYLNPQGNQARRQIVMLHEVNDGEFDLMFVSLNFLKRKYS